MTTIFVEGKDDKRFIEQLLCAIGLNRYVSQVIQVGGYTMLPMFGTEIQRADDSGGRNVVILDADDNKDEKIRLIRQIEDEKQINISRFFMPNDTDDGCLEDLLRKCIVENHLKVVACFDRYQDCVDDLGG